MSKTFKCVEHEEEVLEVYPFTGDEGGRKFSLLMPHVSSNAGIAFDSTTAPALALAILEAAGYAPGEENKGEAHACFVTAMHYIRSGLEIQEREATEAKEQAELEAEALKLLLAFQAIDDPDNRGCEWHQYGTKTKDKWLAVARRAREINKENQ